MTRTRAEQLARRRSRRDRRPLPGELTDLNAFRHARNLHQAAWDGGYTMLGSRRGRTLYRLARDAARRGVPGSLVDCGVWNGGSSILMSLGAPDRTVWCFDSFQGLPAPGEQDDEESWRFVGDCVGSEAKLREGFSRLAPDAHVEVRPGWFADTLEPAAESINSIAVLHCDGDWYESVRLTLDVFYGKVSPGGYVVIDDYGTWTGARRATDELRRAVGDRGRLVRVDHTGRYWRKAD